MNKMILEASLVSAVLFAVGCGDSGDKKVAFADAKIEYKDTGAYDLSHYLVPAQNQISNYVENEYTNKSGKRDYSKTADEDSPSYSVSQFDINGTVIQETVDGALDTTYNILADKVIGTDAEDNSIESYVRYADKDNYIFKMQKEDEELGHVETICKLANYHDSKKVSRETYNDVIEMVCTIDSSDAATVGGSKIEVTGSGTQLRFFAKDKGLISTSIDFCTETKTDGKKTRATCVKITEEITTMTKN